MPMRQPRLVPSVATARNPAKPAGPASPFLGHSAPPSQCLWCIARRWGHLSRSFGSDVLVRGRFTAVNCSRSFLALPLLGLALAGCQALSPADSQSLAARGGEEKTVTRDDDTFTGRLETSTRQLTETVSKPLDPTYWQQERQKSQAAKRLKQQQAAAAKKRQKRSAFMNWLFPEPKQPRTLSEWLSQDRPDN